MISPWMGDCNTLQNGGSVVTLRFVGQLQSWMLWGLVPGTDRFVRGRRWRSSGEEAPDIWRWLTLTHIKLRDEASLRRGKWSAQYMRNLYCLASELAFLVMRFLCRHVFSSVFHFKNVNLLFNSRDFIIEPF